MIGHFTAMVWQASSKVGFGFACNVHPPYYSYIYRECITVARYVTAGNVGGKYKENVRPLK